ncbi:hypothetical protein FACS189430_00870 [Bacteroidia bacterium]|nr:hypothetical protein FACS189430_00870 [Bacteroidia bacterium]
MKKVSVIILAAIMMASCGGSGNSATKSSIKKNEIFGNLPALFYEGWSLKIEDIDWINLTAREYKKISLALDKVSSKAEAEAKKLDGTNVPFTVSEAAQLLYEVHSLKLGYVHYSSSDAYGRSAFNISIYQDITMKQKVKYDYWIAIAKNGTPFYHYSGNTNQEIGERRNYGLELPFTWDPDARWYDWILRWQRAYGEEYDSMELDSYIKQQFEPWSDFDHIEFVTKDEYYKFIKDIKDIKDKDNKRFYIY